MPILNGIRRRPQLRADCVRRSGAARRRCPRSSRSSWRCRSRHTEPWVAAGATLAILTLPAAAESHFVLMAIPLALLRLTVSEFVVIAVLLLVPLEFWPSVLRPDGGPCWPIRGCMPPGYCGQLPCASSARSVKMRHL